MFMSNGHKEFYLWHYCYCRYKQRGELAASKKDGSWVQRKGLGSLLGLEAAPQSGEGDEGSHSLRPSVVSTVHLPRSLRCANVTIIKHGECEDAYPWQHHRHHSVCQCPQRGQRLLPGQGRAWVSDRIPIANSHRSCIFINQNLIPQLSRQPPNPTPLLVPISTLNTIPSSTPIPIPISNPNHPQFFL